MSFKPTIQNTEITEEAMSASKLLKAVANRHRYLILCYIKHREYSVGELEKLTKLSQSALSQHLALLRKEGLVQTRRSAQIIFYRIASNRANQILDFIRHVLAVEDTNITNYVSNFSVEPSKKLPALF